MNGAKWKVKGDSAANGDSTTQFTRKCKSICRPVCSPKSDGNSKNIFLLFIVDNGSGRRKAMNGIDDSPKNQNCIAAFLGMNWSELQCRRSDGTYLVNLSTQIILSQMFLFVGERWWAIHPKYANIIFNSLSSLSDSHCETLTRKSHQSSRHIFLKSIDKTNTRIKFNFYSVNMHRCETSDRKMIYWTNALSTSLESLSI